MRISGSNQPPPPVGPAMPQPVALSMPAEVRSAPAVDQLTVSLASSFTFVFVSGALVIGARFGFNRPSSAPPGTVDLITPLLQVGFFGLGAALAAIACSRAAFVVGSAKSAVAGWTALFGVSALGTGAIAVSMLLT